MLSSAPFCPIPSALAAPMRRSCSSTSTLELGGGAGVVKSGLMSGKRGLVMGVANDHSIAWGIAKALADQGAELAFTYQGEALGKRVKPLAGKPRLVDRAALRRRGPRLGRSGVRRAEGAMGRDRLSRPLHRLFRPRRIEGPLRRHDAREFHAHDGDLGLFLHRNRQARRRADAAGRRDDDADLRRRDPGDAQLQCDGRRQGGAGGERALSRRRFRPGRHPRQRHFGRTRSARWPAPASPTRASCSISSATIRRCAGP